MLKVVDGNLFLAGNDRSGYIQGNDDYVMPASKKAVHIFLRNCAGVALALAELPRLGHGDPEKHYDLLSGRLEPLMDARI